MVKLVYAMEPCDCEAADFVHLAERLYHAVCYPVPTCATFRPYWVKGRRGSPAHFTDECYVCGRLERSHPEALQEPTDA